MKQNKKIDWALMVMIAISIAILLWGCSSTHKIKSSEKLKVETESSTDLHAVKKTDSSSTTTAETAAVKHKDSSAVKTTTTEASETITVNLDTSRGTPVNDFEGAAKVFDVNINGHQIHSNRPINNIVIRNQQGTQVIDAHQVITADSSGSKAAATSTRHTEDSLALVQQQKVQLELEAKNKEVKRTGFSFGSWLWLIILGLVAIAGWYFGWWQWLFALLRRKKKEKSPLAGMTYPDVPKPKET